MITSLAAIAISMSMSPEPLWNISRAAAMEWGREHPVSYLRMELQTDGGPLPFIFQSPSLRYEARLKALEKYIKALKEHEASGKDSEFQPVFFQPESFILNGMERVPALMEPLRTGSYGGPAKGAISFEQYDSVIEMIGSGTCTRPSILPGHFLGIGTWTKKRGDISAVVEISAEQVESPDDRFDIIGDAGEAAAFTGQWSVDFDSSDDLAIGTFTVDANQLATGTFLTTTGDYRYLAGRVDGDLMRLSTFDGAHAFLFHARMQDDGSIEGDFYSGNWHHETWTAVRDDDAKLPDAFEQTVIADEEALAEAVFKDLEGVPTRVLDVLDESKAKARIIEIFGTWCPNCSDAGRELVSLKEQYGDDLAIVGLAFEITEDFERSVEQVKRHHNHIGTSWPILIAGLSDKDKATAALGFLDQVRSYPTLVFLNEANEVQAIYSGFSGPATGEAYKEQRLKFEALIDGMIED